MPAQRTRDNQSRSLDVTTEAPVPPTLSIISPKPLPFAFPATHNLNGSPSSSRSCSPDQDLQFTDPFGKFSMVSIPPNPSFPSNPLQRPFSPESLRAPSPAPSTKRRKSSVSSETSEHRPKKGDPDYIKRPENAFILFRRHCVSELQRELEASCADATVKKKRQADLSKEISKRWKDLTAEERQSWQDQAAQSKKDHLEKYPNYVYRPQRNKDKDGRSKNKPSSSKRGRSTGDEPTISFVVPLPAPRGPRRPSAPTPPPYQSITIPQVVHRLQEPESPSDSLVHYISRASTSTSVANNLFDFIPQNAYVPPPFPSSAHIDSSIQPNFMQNLFQPPPPPQNRVHGPSPLERLAMEIDTSSFKMSTPHSIMSSVSSNPDSPMGPVTPPSLDNNGWFPMHEPIQSLEMLHFPETEADLALKDLEENPYIPNINWGWPSGEHAILDNNWDVNSIPPVLMGDEALMAMGGIPNGKFQHHDGSESIHFNDFSQTLPEIYGYDDMISGNAFATST